MSGERQSESERVIVPGYDGPDMRCDTSRGASELSINTRYVSSGSLNPGKKSAECGYVTIRRRCLCSDRYQADTQRRSG